MTLTNGIILFSKNKLIKKFFLENLGKKYEIILGLEEENVNILEKQNKQEFLEKRISNKVVKENKKSEGKIICNVIDVTCFELEEAKQIIDTIVNIKKKLTSKTEQLIHINTKYMIVYDTLHANKIKNYITRECLDVIMWPFNIELLKIKIESFDQIEKNILKNFIKKQSFFSLIHEVKILQEKYVIQSNELNEYLSAISMEPRTQSTISSNSFHKKLVLYTYKNNFHFLLLFLTLNLFDLLSEIYYVTNPDIKNQPNAFLIKTIDSLSYFTDLNLSLNLEKTSSTQKTRVTFFFIILLECLSKNMAKIIAFSKIENNEENQNNQNKKMTNFLYKIKYNFDQEEDYFILNDNELKTSIYKTYLRGFKNLFLLVEKGNNEFILKLHN